MTEVTKKLLEHNTLDFNLLKAAEELSELSTALLQRVTSDSDRISDQTIIDEIGDVEIRIEILKEIFGEKKVSERVEFKSNKILQRTHSYERV